MKICCSKKCKFKGKPQPIDNFHKDINQDDNHHKQCKQCRKDYGKSEKGQKTIKNYIKNNNKGIKKQQKEYCKTDNGRESKKLSQEKYKQKHLEKSKQNNIKSRKKYDLKNPQKTMARKRLGFAVANGEIIKPEICSLCGKTDCKIEGHHEDYNYPYDVVWCCCKCHLDIHRKNIVLEKKIRNFKDFLKEFIILSKEQITKENLERIKFKFRKNNINIRRLSIRELRKGNRLIKLKKENYKYYAVNIAYFGDIYRYKEISLEQFFEKYKQP